jgi:DtxR family transcriptional regulator, Mn-dependent transcriptional regulator
MSDLIDTTEMYLRTVYELNEEGVPPMRARIADRLHQSGPTVSQTVARMERDGLLRLTHDRLIELTPEGGQRAEAVMRKHRLSERLLTDIIGLDWHLVHNEACRWEHVISAEVEERLVAILPDTSESPYGNPIPGMLALGVDGDLRVFREDNAPLPELVASGSTAEVTLMRMSETLQTDEETLADLAAAGALPGARVSVTHAAFGFRLQVAGHSPVEVSATIAEGLFAHLGSL